MITRSLHLQQPQQWQLLLAQAVSDPQTLLKTLQLDPDLLEPAKLAASGFRLRVPHGYVSRMHPGDPDDPLLRQVLPTGNELVTGNGYSSDPLGEQSAMRLPGLLHKYHGRILLTLTGACAIHCRYCFRRHYAYSENNPLNAHWHNSLDYIRQHPDVKEVIMSGGDPLSLPDSRLADLIAGLESIPHVRILRIHSRMPVVLPERIDTGLISWIETTRLKTVLVIHSNHANEIDHAVATAMAELRHSGVTLLNQSVLLRGVNDSSEALIDLSERLFSVGVLPYYLHQLDRVQGATHFEVDDRAARALFADMRRRLPGYLLPRLVREHPGAMAKTPL
jgi:EF-P beta-lysylation protein EpmB